MNALQTALALGYIRPEAGSLDSAANAVAKFMLPNVSTTMVLPIVPDGAVKGQRYIPPNVAYDIVGNSADYDRKIRRIIAASAAGGLAIGGLAAWVLKRRR